MGCDIHFYVERRVDGRWTTADTWEPSKYDDTGGLHVDYKKAFYSSRNYDLFGILADVRNGRWFAGVDTGEGFVPISAPRDLPDDVTPDVRRASDDWGGDGHSHSFFTVAELLAYDWTQTTVHRGWVDPVNWAQHRDNGKPRTWAGDVGGGPVVKVHPDVFEQAWEKLKAARGLPEHTHPSYILLLDANAERRMMVAEFIELVSQGEGVRRPDGQPLRLGFSPYCQVEWREPYYQSCREFWSDTMPRLLALGKAEDVRCVFWFDN